MLRIFSSAYWPSVYFIYLFLSDYFLCVCVFEPVQIIYYVPLPFLQMVTQSCLILYDPMDCSMPGFPVLHYVPDFAQTHIHWVSDATQSSHPLLPPSPPALSFPTSGSFTMSQLFASGGLRIGASASASVLPVNMRISSVQSLSHVWLPATPWIAARQASLSITNSQSSLRLTNVKQVLNYWVPISSLSPFLR